MIAFELHRRLVTQNTIKSWFNSPSGRGKYRYPAYKLELEKQIFATVGSYCNKGKPRVKKRVKLLYLTKRLQDADNFMACLKPLLDALVKLELIHDDSDKWLELYAKQKVDTKRAYLVKVEVH